MPPPRRRTREEKQAETRARLLEAAARVLHREGFRGASVEKIADEAGYSHGALYSNFAGKDELFLALAEALVAERTGETAAVHAGDEPFADQAVAAADTWMRRLRADPATVILRLEFALHAARDPRLRAALAAREGALTDLLERLIAEHGPPSPLPPAELAQVVRAIGIGLAVEALVEPDRVRDELYGDVVAILLDLLEGREPRSPRD